MGRTILLAALAAGCQFKFERPLKAGELRGKVAYDEPGTGARKPAARARVRLVGTTLGALANEDGAFFFQDVPVGTHTLHVKFDVPVAAEDKPHTELLIPGLSISSRLTGAGTKERAGRDLGTLVVGALGVVSGRVTRDGDPIAGAGVVASGFGAVSTDADGRYTLKLPRGQFDLVALYPDAEKTRVTGKVVLPLRESAKVDFAASPADSDAGTIAGQAFYASDDDQADFSGIRIRLRAAGGTVLFDTGDPADEVKTDARGLWAAADVPAGVYTLRATARGHRDVFLGPIAVFPGAEAPLVVLTPEVEDAAADCDRDGTADAEDDDDDNDGVPDAAEPPACRCDPSGADDADDNGVCDGSEGGGAPALFPIATSDGLDRSFSVAFDGTNFLVGIQTAAAHGGQLVSRSGARVGAPISTGRNGQMPAVAFDGTNYLLTFQDYTQSPSGPTPIAGQLVSPAGSAVGFPFVIAEGVEFQGSHPLVFDGYNYFVAWGTPSFDLHGRFVSPAGTPLETEMLVSAAVGQDTDLAVAFDGTNILVVWADARRDPTSPPTDVYGQLIGHSGWGVAGTLVGSPFPIHEGAAQTGDSGIALAFDGEDYLVVWVDQVPGSNSFSGQLLRPSGSAVGPVIPIAPSGAYAAPGVAFDGIRYLVTWTDLANDANGNAICDASEGTCLDIRGQYVGREGALVGAPFPIAAGPGNELMSQVVFGGGRYLAVWNTGDAPGTGQDPPRGDVYGGFVTPDTGARGKVAVTVSYTGSLGTVSATTPIQVMLTPFNAITLTPPLNGSTFQAAKLSASPAAVTFSGVPAGDYQLVAYLDVNGDGPGFPDPYQLAGPVQDLSDPSTKFAVTTGTAAVEVTVTDAQQIQCPGSPDC